MTPAGTLLASVDAIAVVHNRSSGRHRSASLGADYNDDNPPPFVAMTVRVPSGRQQSAPPWADNNPRPLGPTNPRLYVATTIRVLNADTGVYAVVSDTRAGIAASPSAISRSVSIRHVPPNSTSLGRNRALYAILRLSGTQ